MVGRGGSGCDFRSTDPEIDFCIFILKDWVGSRAELDASHADMGERRPCISLH